MLKVMSGAEERDKLRESLGLAVGGGGGVESQSSQSSKHEAELMRRALKKMRAAEVRFCLESKLKKEEWIPKVEEERKKYGPVAPLRHQLLKLAQKFRPDVVVHETKVFHRLWKEM